MSDPLALYACEKFELDFMGKSREEAAMISAGNLHNLEENNLTFLSLILNSILIIRRTASRVANRQNYVAKWKEISFDLEVLNFVKGLFQLRRMRELVIIIYNNNNLSIYIAQFS